MQKTTVYLTRELKRALERVARQRRVSEAALLREAIARLADEAAQAPAPRLPLFRGRGRPISRDVDRELARGFGQR